MIDPHLVHISLHFLFCFVCSGGGVLGCVGVCWGVLGVCQSIFFFVLFVLVLMCWGVLGVGPDNFQGGRGYKIFEKYLNPPKSLSYAYH